MPQLWSFSIPESKVDGSRYDEFPVRFWLDYDEKSAEGSGLRLHWIEQPQSVEIAKIFFSEEHDRLVSLKNWYDEHPDEIEDIPNDEKDRIWAYHRNLSVALRGAVDALKKEVPSDEHSSESGKVSPAAEAANKGGRVDEL